MSKSSGSQSSESNSEKSAEKLPFEPVSTRAKIPKAEPTIAQKYEKYVARKSNPPSTKPIGTSTVPEVVSRRMVARMAFFSGIPTFLGMMTFVASYFVIKQMGIPLPNYAVLLVSLGFFGLGVLGLSYGILSTCWDEESTGSLLGFEQFGLNFGRVRGAWKETRQKQNT